MNEFVVGWQEEDLLACVSRCVLHLIFGWDEETIWRIVITRFFVTAKDICRGGQMDNECEYSLVEGKMKLLPLM